MLENGFDKKREKYAIKLIKWLIKKEKKSHFFLKIYFFVYQLLVFKNSYDPEYIPNENHHYIQRFIIENFSKSKGVVYQYEYGVKVELKSINKEAACIKGYYDAYHIKRKKLTAILEKRNYSFIEMFGKIIIEDYIFKLSKGKVDLENFNASQLASYVAFQYVRTPSFRAQLKNFFLFLIENRGVNKNLFSNKRKYDLFSILLNNTLNITRDELVNFNLLNKKCDRNVESDIRSELENLNAISNLASVVVGNHIAESIFKKNSFIIEANNPYFFILPDSGVMIYDFNYNANYFWPYGWNFLDKKIAIFFPLSPEKCLVYTDLDLTNESIQEEFVKMAILLAYQQKLKYVYSNKEDKYIQYNINKFKPLHNFD